MRVAQFKTKLCNKSLTFGDNEIGRPTHRLKLGAIYIANSICIGHIVNPPDNIKLSSPEILKIIINVLVEGKCTQWMSDLQDSRFD